MNSLSHGLGIIGNGIAQHINFKKYERNVENDIIEMGEKNGIFLDFVIERQSRKTIYREKCQHLKFRSKSRILY